MLTKTQFWILTTLAALGLFLVLANMVVFSQNRQAQAEISQRAQYIQQSAQLESLYRDMIKALADLSVRNQDDQLRDMLSRHGITVSAGLPQPAVGGAPAAQARKGGK
jgi:type VI protein secretion system component VasK